MIYDEVESCFSLYACDAYSLWVERSLVQLVQRSDPTLSYKSKKKILKLDTQADPEVRTSRP